MKNFEALIAVALVFFITGLAVASVGTVPECDGKPVGWTLPAAVFCMMTIPALLMYIAGRIDGAKS